MLSRQPSPLTLAVPALFLYLATPVKAATLDENAKIVLACLLGGVPLLGILMMIALCIWIRKRKRALRQHALQNGIELDADGWPVDPHVEIDDNLNVVRVRAGGDRTVPRGQSHTPNVQELGYGYGVTGAAERKDKDANASAHPTNRARSRSPVASYATAAPSPPPYNDNTTSSPPGIDHLTRESQTGHLDAKTQQETAHRDSVVGAAY